MGSAADFVGSAQVLFSQIATGVTVSAELVLFT